MEYIDGKTLKEYLEEKETPLSEEETLRLIRPVLNALSQIHEERIIHRDISPENIMIAHSGQVVLIDFGACPPDFHRSGDKKSDRTFEAWICPCRTVSDKGKAGPVYRYLRYLCNDVPDDVR